MKSMLLIKAKHIITQDKKRRIIKNGAILVKEDKIFDIGYATQVERKYKSEIGKTIEGENLVAMPGLINTHTHVAMTLLRGYADDMPLEKWWLEKVFPFEAKLTGEDIYWGTLLGEIEMIKSGTTCFADFYFFADKIAQAVSELGMRANIGIPVLDFKTPEFKTPDEALEAVPRLVAGGVPPRARGGTTPAESKTDNLIQFSIAPHMAQTTSLKTYKKCKQTADKYKLLLQTHLAETKREVEYSIKDYRGTPVEVLVKNQILDKNSIVAHACHLTDTDIKLLAKNKVNISHCPVSNMKLASGIMPLNKLQKAGINIALGTDGACSNNNLDMFEEMKTAALLHKVSNSDPTIANAQTILDMATINGAKALGIEKQIGSLEKSKKADIIIIDFNKPHLTPCYNPISHLVYSVSGSDVDSAIINGKIVMEKRKILAINEVKVLKNINTRFQNAK